MKRTSPGGKNKPATLQERRKKGGLPLSKDKKITPEFTLTGKNAIMHNKGPGQTMDDTACVTSISPFSTSYVEGEPNDVSLHCPTQSMLLTIDRPESTECISLRNSETMDQHGRRGFIGGEPLRGHSTVKVGSVRNDIPLHLKSSIAKKENSDTGGVSTRVLTNALSKEPQTGITSTRSPIHDEMPTTSNDASLPLNPECKADSIVLLPADQGDWKSMIKAIEKSSSEPLGRIPVEYEYTVSMKGRKLSETSINVSERTKYKIQPMEFKRDLINPKVLVIKQQDGELLDASVDSNITVQPTCEPLLNDQVDPKAKKDQDPSDKESSVEQHGLIDREGGLPVDGEGDLHPNETVSIEKVNVTVLPNVQVLIESPSCYQIELPKDTDRPDDVVVDAKSTKAPDTIGEPNISQMYNTPTIKPKDKVIKYRASGINSEFTMKPKPKDTRRALRNLKDTRQNAISQEHKKKKKKKE